MNNTATKASTFKPRLNAITVVQNDDGTWHFELSERATHFEVALLGVHYKAQFSEETQRGTLIYKPHADFQAAPTREQLAEKLNEGFET